MEEIMFFLNTPWEGVDYRLVRKFIQQVVMNPLIVMSVCLILRFLLKKRRKYLTFILFMPAFLIFSFLMSIVIIGIQGMFFMPTSQFYEEHYVDPQEAKITFGKEKKNLIFITVESLEKTYSNKAFYGQSLIPDLEKLQGTRFLAYMNGYGASFTQGFWIATFCGIPSNYFSGGYINAMGQYSFEKKLKHLYSLGKILKRHQYKTVYMKGADGAFSGAETFMKNHGIDEFIDKKIIAKKYPDFIQGSWGFEDADLMTVLKNKMTALAKQEPFAVFVETVDMHGSNIVVNPIPDKFGDPYLNAIYHTNQVVADFVKWFEKRKEFKDTVMIIVGDHLRMGTDVKMPQGRQIYNLFINAPEVKTTNRMFTQIDMFPTVLEAMGANIEGHTLGLGVSVFSDKKTLIEEMGEKNLRSELKKRNKIYEKLWNN